MRDLYSHTQSRLRLPRLSVCLPLFVCLSACKSRSLPLCLSLCRFHCLSLCLPFCPSMCPFLCLPSVRPIACPSVRPLACLIVRPFACPSVCLLIITLSVRLLSCVSVCLSVFRPIHPPLPNISRTTVIGCEAKYD